MIKKFIYSDRFLISLGVGMIGGFVTFFATHSIGWAIIGIFLPSGLYSYFIAESVGSE